MILGLITKSAAVLLSNSAFPSKSCPAVSLLMFLLGAIITTQEGYLVRYEDVTQKLLPSFYVLHNGVEVSSRQGSV